MPVTTPSTACAETAVLGRCYDCGAVLSNNLSTTCARADRCADCARRLGYVRCAGCGHWLANVEQYRSGSYSGDEGVTESTYCSACFYNRFRNCTGCDDIFSTADMVSVAGALYCTGCSSRRENFSPAGFRNLSGCTTKIGSERCFGVELETNGCAGFGVLRDNGAWGAKNDPTCAGKEFYSDILYGDEGLEAIADLAGLAKRNDWRIGRSCGYHLHIDMREENDDSLFAAAYAYCATSTVWHSFVPRHRRNNSYCCSLDWDCSDIGRARGSFCHFVRDIVYERYNWFNLQAYERHTTFEIRLHHASLDEVEVCNWVKAHTRFTDWATTLGLAGVKEKLDGKSIDERFDIIAREAWADEELRSYYASKRQRQAQREARGEAEGQR